MNYTDFNAFCESLTATTHVVQWGDADVWKVGGKVFAIGGWSQSDQPAITFKVSDSNYHFLSGEPGYRPAPYFATRGMKWIQQHGVPVPPDADLHYYLTESHRLVAAKLTRKLRRELGLDEA